MLHSPNSPPELTDRVRGPAEVDGDEGADEASPGGEDLHLGGVTPVESRPQQQREVAHLVRDLVEEDRERGDAPRPEGDEERAPQRQAVGEVVDCVGDQVQVTRDLQFHAVKTSRRDRSWDLRVSRVVSLFCRRLRRVVFLLSPSASPKWRISRRLRRLLSRIE